MDEVKILIVENEPLMAAELESRIARLGFRVTCTAFSCETAIKEADREIPDVILMDINTITDMSGIKTAGKIQNRFDIPVLFLISHTEEINTDQMNIYRPAGYVTKPLRDTELKAAIELSLFGAKAEAERRRIESFQKVTVKILKTLNVSSEHRVDLIRRVLTIIKNDLGFEAVGIRLKEGDKYPYFETIGFPPCFVERENFLCARTAEGMVLREGEGNPVLECMCGNVIRQKIDPSQPFFGAGGSFWTNSTSDLLSAVTEDEHKVWPKNRCNRKGYESVALIPLRSDSRVIGLLQLNDRRKNMIFPAMIPFLEGIAESIGIALNKMKNEEILRLNETKYRILIETLPQKVYHKDKDLDYVSCNTTFVKDLGIGPEEIAGKSDYDLYPREMAEKFRNNDREVISSGKTLVLEEHYAQGDTRLTLQSVKTPVRDRQGKISGIIGISWDITEKKRAENIFREAYKELEKKLYDRTTRLAAINSRLGEEIAERGEAEKALKESERRLRSIIENSKAGYFFIDTDGLFQEVNKAWLKMYKYQSSDEVIGSHFTSVQKEEDVERAREVVKGIMAGEVRHQSGEFSRKCRDDSIGYHSFSARPVISHGEVIGLEGFIIDTTERKLAEEKLRETLIEKEFLLKEIHHRVKNNMQVITSLLHLQADKVNNKCAYDAILDSQNRIKAMAIIHEALYSSGAGGVVDFQEYITKLVTHLSLTFGADKRGISFTIDLKNLLVPLDQAVPCGLVLNELVTNSLKHAFLEGGPGKIRIIGRRQENRCIEITVSDDGTGISTEIDWDNAGSLGLSLVKGFVEKQLRGTLSVHNNQGTEIRFTLGPYSEWKRGT